MKKKAGLKARVAMLDFDNTITRHDTIDSLLERFSMDDQWIILEKLWKNRKIGSRVCLEGQIKGIRITRRELKRYLGGIKLDPYFKKLIRLLRSKKIRPVIVTDNFDIFVAEILRRHNVGRIPVYSNKVSMVQNRLVPRFPLTNKECGTCANCKKRKLLSHRTKYGKIIYIGDGLSDLCASKHADMVFAKGSLIRHCLEEGLEHVPFKNLKDVCDYFERSGS
ncbi:MAG: MtnX-like HAD-IB family phosphatase [Candidatus Omnitrophica bacterium]|nr:MtnX-like HAD-IB family phosphatase [Candidatus Omnitrophota bacterium]